MADSEVGNLTAASALDGTELIHVVQGGNSRYTTTDAIAALAGGGTPVPTIVQSKAIATNDMSAGITLDAAPTEGNRLIAIAFTTQDASLPGAGASWSSEELNGSVPHSNVFFRTVGPSEGAAQFPTTLASEGVVCMVEVTGSALASNVLSVGTSTVVSPSITYVSNYLANATGLALVYGIRRSSEIGTWGGSFTDALGYADDGTLSGGTGGSIRLGTATVVVNSTLSGGCTWPTSLASKAGFILIS